tara:strand:- start:29 stop:763 length:735 start_codon:yes stop_codon:yes gene_type:complete
MIVIVLGMHRSGTSAIAGILHLNKIIMGSKDNFKPKPLPQNPKGFYENYDFRKINDKILNDVNYKVKSLNYNIPIPLPRKKIESKMEYLIKKQIEQYSYWGWKDPRTCLTLDHWLNIILKYKKKDDIKIIFTIRDPLAVANSLKKRDGLDIHSGLKLWRVYNQRALNFVNSYKISTFYFFYEQLIINPNDVNLKMFKFLKIDSKQEIISKFIDSKLNRSEQRKVYKIPNEFEDLKNKFKDLSSV